jgi:hypothetical protein
MYVGTGSCKTVELQRSSMNHVWKGIRLESYHIIRQPRSRPVPIISYHNNINIKLRLAIIGRWAMASPRERFVPAADGRTVV